jgi:hypothetical protein
VYAEYIKKEREFSTKFLKKNKIKEERFNENNYEVIEKIFKDEDFIKTIYNNIDQILKDMKVEENDKNLRFLTIGDFLFTITSLRVSNPESFIFKISRNDYFQELEKRIYVNKIFNYDAKFYRDIHRKLLLGLRRDEIIIKEELRIFSKKS